MVKFSYRKRKVVYDMNKVEQFIKEQNKIILEDREKTLIALGLTEKEYAPDDKDLISIWEYPKYDYVNDEKKYYREVAIKVTDEEYALILSKAKQVEEIMAKEKQNQQNEENDISHNVIKNGYLYLKNLKMQMVRVRQQRISVFHIIYYLHFLLLSLLSLV